MKIKKVGFFFELSPTQRKVELTTLRQERAQKDEDRILSYLQNCTMCAGVPQIEEDVLSTPPCPIGPPNLCTDGEWIWPETLVYYLKTYHIMLPEEFLRHLANVSWKCPAGVVAEVPLLDDQVMMG